MMVEKSHYARADTPGPTRLESDSLGRVAVPASVYWGGPDIRLLSHFSIGHDRRQGATFPT